MNIHHPSDGRPLKRYPTPAELIRFLSHVKVDAETGCWVWQKHCDPDGYPQFSFAGRAHWAHRFSQQVFNRELSKGIQADHICSNPSCVNPEHLRPLGVVQNSQNGARQKPRDRKKRKKIDLIDEGEEAYREHTNPYYKCPF
jgi:hypothetical protein